MKITPKPTPQTFTDLLDSMEIDEKKAFGFECASGVRSAIYRISNRSEKGFSTMKKRKSDKFTIEVIRLK